ncbi:Crp/Fnr family transcriptional regulator [Microvirga ossetica]|uniref:Crp/Fnr family transcriptional regulator n=1 Tax=Microvirga ossetica TaxID=1882682 RepID=A0A1B2EBH7_9HYPH|nr:Crp/Fnr family transcriptional regulator [Microvirga ossetica]ANY77346.1 Crp/Fnr family transcriptional regulator [Microvirga ossetica]
MAHLSNTATHRANRLLATLEPKDFAYLLPHLEIITLHRRQVLYEAGETICYTYFPHDAVVSLVNVLDDGGSVEVAIFGREGVFGLISALFTRESFGRYIVQIPGTASRVEIEWVREAVNASPRMRLLLYRFTEALLAQTFQIVTCNAVHNVEARCCRWLLSTHDRVEQDTLPLTHEFLAEMLGTQRPSVSIVLRTLQNAGLIRQRRGGIVITDRAGLEEAACECYGKIRRSYERLLPHTYPPVDEDVGSTVA